MHLCQNVLFIHAGSVYKLRAFQVAEGNFLMSGLVGIGTCMLLSFSCCSHHRHTGDTSPTLHSCLHCHHGALDGARTGYPLAVCALQPALALYACKRACIHCVRLGCSHPAAPPSSNSGRGRGSCCCGAPCTQRCRWAGRRLGGACVGCATPASAVVLCAGYVATHFVYLLTYS